jgi:hypothetical protein
MNPSEIPITVFRLGKLVATPNALQHISHEDILLGIKRHQMADWGDLGEEDRSINDACLRDGGRLLSVYHSKTGVKFYIITEADRSATTVLLPEDY